MQTEGLREGFRAVRTTGRQIPHVPFQLQLLGQGEGSAGGSGQWERAEPWAAIKRKSRTQEVTSVVGTSALASLLSLCLQSDCLEAALAEADTRLIKSCRGASPLQRQTLFAQATQHENSSCCRGCSARAHCLVWLLLRCDVVLV